MSLVPPLQTLCPQEWKWKHCQAGALPTAGTLYPPESKVAPCGYSVLTKWEPKEGPSYQNFFLWGENKNYDTGGKLKKTKSHTPTHYNTTTLPKGLNLGTEIMLLEDQEIQNFNQSMDYKGDRRQF